MPARIELLEIGKDRRRYLSFGQSLVVAAVGSNGGTGVDPAFQHLQFRGPAAPLTDGGGISFCEFLQHQLG